MFAHEVIGTVLEVVPEPDRGTARGVRVVGIPFFVITIGVALASLAIVGAQRLAVLFISTMDIPRVEYYR